jgi:hypothetical protein
MATTATSSHKTSVLAFFLLATVLIVPLLILGALTGWVLLPGLPVAALGAWSPMLAALMLVYRSEKKAGVLALLKRSYDFNRIKAKRWYVPILLTMPTAAAVTFGVQRLTGVEVPIPHIEVVRTLALCVIGYVGALGEELARMVRLCHRLAAGSLGSAQRQSDARSVLGRVPLPGVSAGSSFGGLDSLVDAVHHSGTRDHGVDIQQYWWKSVRHGALPHDFERCLAVIPGKWFVVGFPCCGPNVCRHGGAGCARVGTVDARAAFSK